MASDEISASPPLSSSRTIADTIFSTRSGSTGRLRREICKERTSLSRSKGTRRPLRLITVNSRSCTRSKVVKRKLQAMHTRRLRITWESSVGRESFTCVSRLLQLGQRIVLNSDRGLGRDSITGGNGQAIAVWTGFCARYRGYAPFVPRTQRSAPPLRSGALQSRGPLAQAEFGRNGSRLRAAA